MKDNREFKTVVKTIERAEKDVDKVLKAARLNRTESGRISSRNLEMILEFLFGIGVLVFILAFFYLMTR